MKLSTRWREVDHTADTGIEVWAKSFLELILEAGIAISELTTDIDSIDSTEEHLILVEENELDLLLAEFLKELIYLQETKRSRSSIRKPRNNRWRRDSM